MHVVSFSLVVASTFSYLLQSGASCTFRKVKNCSKESNLEIFLKNCSNVI